MKKSFQLGIGALLVLSACATPSNTTNKTDLPMNESLVLGQDYSAIASVLVPLGTKKRIKILKVDAKPVSKDNTYSLKVAPGEHTLSLDCQVVFDNQIHVRNSFELRITTEGSKTYKLNAFVTQDRHCEVKTE